jgi:hypothetical protein
MSYDDLKEFGSENAVKAAGKLRQQGKPYESTSSLLYTFVPSLYKLLQWLMVTSHTGNLVHKKCNVHLSKYHHFHQALYFAVTVGQTGQLRLSKFQILWILLQIHIKSVLKYITLQI